MSPYPKYINDTIEIMIKNSESYFVNLHADCQEAFAYIDTTSILPTNIYVSVQINYKENYFQLINPSNLPINFSFDEIDIPDKVEIHLSPNNGKIPPRTAKMIKFNATYYQSNYF
jgi:hypothetical protein